MENSPQNSILEDEEIEILEERLTNVPKENSNTHSILPGKCMIKKLIKNISIDFIKNASINLKTFHACRTSYDALDVY